MKNVFLVCAAIMSMVTAVAQTSYAPYYEKTRNAYCNMAEGNYNIAVKLYEEALADYYPFHYDLADLRDCYLALGDTTNAVNCVKRVIAYGWQLQETYPVINREPLENTIGAFDSAQIAYITSIYPALRQTYLQQIDPNENSFLQEIQYHTACKL